MTRWHAEKLAQLKNAVIRLACDGPGDKSPWVRALDLVLCAGIPKSRVRTYVLVGFNTGPEECWDRCNFVRRKHGIFVNPQWFHSLTALKKNEITDRQRKLGWTKARLYDIMEHFYKFKDRRELYCLDSASVVENYGREL